MTGWSMLVQIVTVDPRRLAGRAAAPAAARTGVAATGARHAVVMAMVTPTTANVLNKLGPRMVLLTLGGIRAGRAPTGDLQWRARDGDRGQALCSVFPPEALVNPKLLDRDVGMWRPGFPAGPTGDVYPHQGVMPGGIAPRRGTTDWGGPPRRPR